MFVNSDPLNILVIEDNPADFFLLGQYLAEAKINTNLLVCAENLTDACIRIQEQKFDVVFLDLSLPDTIPTETFSSVKPLLPSTPIIVLSGMDAVKLAQQSLQQGAQDYLIKDKLDATMLSKSVYYSIERVKHTLKIIESESWFRHIASQFPNGIIAVLDKNLKIVFAVGGEMKGFGIRSQSMIGKAFTDAFPANEAERIEKLLKDASQNNAEPFEIQYLDQTYIASIASVSSPAEAPDSLLVVLQNITAAKHTADQLRFQSAVLSNITDAVVACDAENKIVYWSRAASDIFGYEDEDVIGKAIVFLTADIHEMPSLSSINQHLLVDSSYETTVRLQTKENIKIWVDMKISSNYDSKNERNGLIYVLKDVTERKAEEHLLTLFQSAILNTNDAVLITEAWPDLQMKARKIVFANNAFTKMTGYHAEEVIGETALLFLGPETDPEELKRIRHSLNRWEPIETELAYYRKDGILIWVSMAITPVSDQRGRFTHWVYIQRDNTESRKTAAALKSQNEALIKTNQELDRFVYSASHDLRAPLTSILGLLTLMQLEGKSGDSDSYINKIRESVNRLDRFIQDIINYSRSSRLVPVQEEIDFQKILQTSVSMHEYMFNLRDLDYRFENDSMNPFFSDPERWQIIVNNLVSNSMKFSRTDIPAVIRMKLSEENQNLIFIYEDNGLGIPENQQARVFEMFYRANEVSHGSGLGLYIVKQTVEILGGSISVESKTGAFTRFTIVIPISNQKGAVYAEKSH